MIFMVLTRRKLRGYDTKEFYFGIILLMVWMHIKTYEYLRIHALKIKKINVCYQILFTYSEYFNTIKYFPNLREFPWTLIISFEWTALYV